MINCFSGTNLSQNPNPDGTEKQLNQNLEITAIKSETEEISQKLETLVMIMKQELSKAVISTERLRW